MQGSRRSPMCPSTCAPARCTPCSARTAPASRRSWVSPPAPSAPDGGTIVVDGELVEQLTPRLATQLGIAIVHQHPAVLPDLTVAENIRVAVPARASSTFGRQRRRVDATDARRRRLARAPRGPRRLADAWRRSTCWSWPRRSSSDPKLLILDEPTAPLGADAVDLLFERVAGGRRRKAPPSSTSPTASRRSGCSPTASPCCATASCGARPTVDDITDDELLALIVGPAAGLDLPAKLPPRRAARRRRSSWTASAGAASPTSPSRPAAARSSASPASSATARASVLRALAGLESFTGSRHGRRERTTRRGAAAALGLPARRPAPTRAS